MTPNSRKTWPLVTSEPFEQAMNDDRDAKALQQQGQQRRLVGLLRSAVVGRYDDRTNADAG